MDRSGHVEGTALPQYQKGDNGGLADKHAAENEQSPQRRSPEFPDAGWALAGRDDHGRIFGCESIHQQAFD